MQDYQKLVVWERAHEFVLTTSAFPDSELLLAHDLSFFETVQYQQLSTELAEIRRILNAFIPRLTTNN
jgi:hypothetical protein